MIKTQKQTSQKRPPKKLPYKDSGLFNQFRPAGASMLFSAREFSMPVAHTVKAAIIFRGSACTMAEI
jgi:hypothetical protein